MSQNSRPCALQAENAIKQEYAIQGPSPEDLKRARLKEMESERSRQVRSCTLPL